MRLALDLGLQPEVACLLASCGALAIVSALAWAAKRFPPFE